MCKEGYFDLDCDIPCTSRNNSTGHFTCDTNGTKVCLPGYQSPETNCVEETVPRTASTPVTQTTTRILTMETSSQSSDMPTRQTITHTPLSIVMVSTAPETIFVIQELTTNSDISPSAVGADIVPIVAGGVAAGLVVLVLILIVNIVLVVGVLKVKCMKHYSNKQGTYAVIIDVLKHLYYKINTFTIEVWM